MHEMGGDGRVLDGMYSRLEHDLKINSLSPGRPASVPEKGGGSIDRRTKRRR